MVIEECPEKANGWPRLGPLQRAGSLSFTLYGYSITLDDLVFFFRGLISVTVQVWSMEWHRLPLSLWSERILHSQSGRSNRSSQFAPGKLLQWHELRRSLLASHWARVFLHSHHSVGTGRRQQPWKYNVVAITQSRGDFIPTTTPVLSDRSN